MFQFSASASSVQQPTQYRLKTGDLPLPSQPGSNKIIWFPNVDHPVSDDQISGLTVDRLYKEAIMGQQRTAARKPPVFLIGSIVIKGPFTPEKTKELFERVKYFKDMKTHYILFPLGGLQFPNGSYYILYPNLYKDIETLVEETKDRFDNDRPCRIMVKREIIIKIAGEQKIKEGLKDPVFRTAFYGSETDSRKDVLINMIYDYIMLYILKVGDVNTANTLVDTRSLTPIIIDYDENRVDVEGQGSVFFLTFAPASETKLTENFIPLYPRVIEKIQKIISETQFILTDSMRIQLGRATNNLEKIFSEKFPNFDNNNLINYPDNQNMAFQQPQLYQPPQPGPYNQPQSFQPPTSGQQPFSSASYNRSESFQVPVVAIPQSSTSFQPQFQPQPSITPSKETTSAKGGRGGRNRGRPPGSTNDLRTAKGTEEGYNQVRTPSNKFWKGANEDSPYDLTTAKSAIQKGIRRGNIELTLMAVHEMYSSNMGPRGLFNRLRVIAAEDIGLAAIPLVSYVLDKTGDWSHNLTTMKRTTNPTQMTPLAEIIPAVWLMCKAPKTRLLSHLWGMYTKEAGRYEAKKRGVPMDIESTVDESAVISGAIFSKYRNDVKRQFNDTDSHKFFPISYIMFSRLQKKDPTAIYWLSLYLYHASFKENKMADRGAKLTKDKIGKPKPYRAEEVLFSLFKDLMPSNDILITRLRQAYFVEKIKLSPNASNQRIGDKVPSDFSFDDSRVFLMMLTVYYLFYGDTRAQHLQPEEIDPKLKNDAAPEIAYSLLQMKYKLIYPEYVIDMHTRIGSKKKVGKETFLREGSRVENEDMRFRVEVAYQIYNLLK